MQSNDASGLPLQSDSSPACTNLARMAAKLKSKALLGTVEAPDKVWIIKEIPGNGLVTREIPLESNESAR